MEINTLHEHDEGGPIHDADEVQDLNNSPVAETLASDQQTELENKPSNGDTGDTRFYPPLYRQRYCFVASVLREESVTTVADFGCSECKVLPILKGVASLEEILGVDIDKPVLQGGVYLTRPLLADYLVKRSRPLTMRLLCGSVAEYDARLQGVEAITMIEVIEHLYPETLSSLVHNVFVNIRPRLIVMTTPNSEYNVVFPGNPKKFRHWDHKFEWTQAEFQDWCDSIGKNHGYTVAYSGLGDPPPDKCHIGYCTQIAVMKKKDAWPEAGGPEAKDKQPYEQVTECIHPHEQALPLDERIVIETSYYVRLLEKQYWSTSEEDMDLANPDNYSFDYEQDYLKVSLEYLLTLSQFQKLSIDVLTFRDVLKSSTKFNLTDDEQFIIHSTSEVETSSWSSEEYSDAVEVESDQVTQLLADSHIAQDNTHVEIWDT